MKRDKCDRVKRLVAHPGVVLDVARSYLYPLAADIDVCGNHPRGFLLRHLPLTGVDRIRVTYRDITVRPRKVRVPLNTAAGMGRCQVNGTSGPVHGASLTHVAAVARVSRQ